MILPATTRIGRNVDLRFISSSISIGNNVVFDDNVRVVVPKNGSLHIADNVKIGVGSVLNCGGDVVIGEKVTFYGYCYLQSSRWFWKGASKQYTYYSVIVEDRVVLAPFTSVCGDVTISPGYISAPSEVIGEW